ncbi:MAG: GNAT family protein [Firmicutes bacterium]|uniref:Ribosomal-protein-alanine N-acetyltransferase n=1 Tax=Melghirimyces thermohalophilus TaxID=1236220 RepID=A0A1G6QLX1_9BACL|nr:GNAT family protein [Melghirimyces thermohalophilus]MDA8354212.1 GNAT family protein [Bacillota bacterium]SDC92677.1 ribosomal-protein-alanine N-acetyltransferase [Melghirimyces thermohalophilus]
MNKKMMGDRLYLRRPELDDAAAFLTLRSNNRSFLRPYEPHHPERTYTLEGQQASIRRIIHQWEQGTGFATGIFLHHSDQLIGRVHLSNVTRGAWQNCTIGYFLDQECQGKGYMTEAVRLAVSFAFREAGLHRVEASVLPANIPSIRVLEKVGFRYIGLSRAHLKIDGAWRDHLLYSLTSEMEV